MVILILLAVISALGPQARADDQMVHCPRQALVRCRPSELGVVNVALIGQLFDYEENKTRSVTVRGFVKVSRTALNTTRLFGYVWIDDDRKPWYPAAPNHHFYLKNTTALPNFYFRSLGPGGFDDGVRVNVSFSEGRVPDMIDLAFRLDAEIHSIKPTMFRVKVGDWPRETEFSIHDCQGHHGLITPWHNMSGSLGAHLAHAVVHGGLRKIPSRRLHSNARLNAFPPPAESPLVLVLFIMHADYGHNAMLHQARQVLRYVEYHIAQAGMQRIMVYVRQHIYMVDLWRDYMATHMPPQVLPFVTFVMWSPDMEVVQACWDQHFAYYHAATALSGHVNVMASYPDLDEYIAWPKPAKSLHEALARCNTSHMQYMPIASMYTNCASCQEKYKTQTDAEPQMWASCESPAAAATRNASISGTMPAQAKGDNARYQTQDCRWYKEDPLLQYTKSWDDWFFVQKNETWEDRLRPGGGDHNGKFIARVQETMVFCMHRAEMFGDYDQRRRDLNPDTCPYLMHAFNINHYRGDLDRGGLPRFQKNWRLDWWLLPDK